MDLCCLDARGERVEVQDVQRRRKGEQRDGGDGEPRDHVADHAETHENEGTDCCVVRRQPGELEPVEQHGEREKFPPCHWRGDLAEVEHEADVGEERGGQLQPDGEKIGHVGSHLP